MASLNGQVNGLFDYGAVTPDAIEEAVSAAIAEVDEILDAVVAVPDGDRTFANTVLPLDEVDDVLSRADGSYGFLAYVSTDESLRAAARENEEKLSTFATGIGFREDVYLAVEAYAGSSEAQGLDRRRARLVEFTLRDFRRNGMTLDTDARARVQALQERLVKLGIDFRRHIDEVDAGILLTRDRLAGLPDSYVDALTTVDTDEGPRYRVSLDYPELFPFLSNAHDGEARRELFLTNHTKAAAENLPLLTEAIAVRDEIATILGYESWAAFVLEVKMANAPVEADTFLADLCAKVTPKAQADLAILGEVKARHAGGDEPVQQWDWRYYTEKLLKEEYRVDAFEVAGYFPLDAVLEGLFDLYQRMVGVLFVEVANPPAWHDDVRLFRIEDAASGELLSHFYFDLHPRPDKFGHAAAFTLVSGRERPDGTYQRPVSAVVANFTKPTPAQPSLLQHREVVTLFHEFGHILHQTMTRSPFTRFSGTRVERDFVEAPSQMLEHWVWSPELLASFARHHETGETIPADLVARMVEAKNVSSGLAALRQIYFGLLDLAYHGPGKDKDTDAIAEELHPVTGFPFEPDTHFQAGFGHLFGYDAGYYGYMWSKVYGDDMYTMFDGSDLEGQGRRYRELILERGGMVDGADLVRDFLGREPETGAFLADLGLT